MFTRAGKPQEMVSTAGVTATLRQIGRSAVLHAFSALRRRTQVNSVKVFCFHYLFPNSHERFDMLLRDMKAHGDFISIPELAEMINRRRPPAGRYYCLTADDGFENVVLDAFQICRANKVPLAVFVPARFISTVPCEPTEFFRNAEYSARIPLASVHQLKHAQSQGLVIGSHTRSHRRLVELESDFDELASEIVESRTDLCNVFGSCTSFAWPFGRNDSIGPRGRRLIPEAGYELAFSGVRGAVTTRADRFSLPRHHFEPHWPLAHSLYFATQHSG